MALCRCSFFNWLLAFQPYMNGESFRDLSLSWRIVGCSWRRNCIPVSIQWLVLLGRGKSITVIIMTIEANSTATSIILKPSAAAAYQRAPWDQQEAAYEAKTSSEREHSQTHALSLLDGRIFEQISTSAKSLLSRQRRTVVSFICVLYLQEAFMCPKEGATFLGRKMKSAKPQEKYNLKTVSRQDSVAVFCVFCRD